MREFFVKEVFYHSYSFAPAVFRTACGGIAVQNRKAYLYYSTALAENGDPYPFLKGRFHLIGPWISSRTETATPARAISFCCRKASRFKRNPCTGKQTMSSPKDWTRRKSSRGSNAVRGGRTGLFLPCLFWTVHAGQKVRGGQFCQRTSCGSGTASVRWETFRVSPGVRFSGVRSYCDVSWIKYNAKHIGRPWVPERSHRSVVVNRGFPYFRPTIIMIVCQNT